jgi:Transposase DDE domain
MEVELWAEISQAICDVQEKFKSNPRDLYPTARIVRVHLWAVLHDRPTVWGCDPRHWTGKTRPPQMPNQSTMSRRMRRDDFQLFLQAMARRLNGKTRSCLLKVIDGKPLELPNHTGDPDAGWGRGVSRKSIGYKLHMIHSGNPMPDAFVITPLDVSEKQMAARMIRRIKGCGYLLGDGNYDASWLYDVCRLHQHLLVSPRAKPGTGIGHHYLSPQRLRSIQLLEPPGELNNFGQTLYDRRTDVERGFSQMTCFGGGLTTLPPWVRRYWRVRNWVFAKLLINAARVRIRRNYAA